MKSQKEIKIVLIRCPQPELITANGDLLSTNRKDTPEPSLPQVHGILQQYSEQTGVRIEIVQLDLRGSVDGQPKETEYGEVSVPYAGKLTKRYTGVSLNDVRSLLEEADFIGFTNNFTIARGVIERHIREVRELFPEKEIWIGGRDVYPENIETIYAEAAKNRCCVIFRGHVFQSLKAYLDFKIRGRGKPSGIVIFNEAGNKYESPAKQLPKGEFDFPLPIYKPEAFRMSLSGEGDLPDELKPLAHMTISIGCPHKCEYCTTSKREKVLTYKNLETIRKELDILKAAGVRTISIMDDNLLALGPKKVKKILNLINSFDFYVEYGNGLQLSLLQKWWNEISEPVLGKCVCLYAPIEDLTTNRLYRKLDEFNSQLSLMERIARNPGNLKFLTMGVIIGVPGHTRKGLTETLPRNLETLLDVFGGSSLEVAATIFNYMPLSGTAFGDLALNSRRMIADPREHPELISFGTPSFVPEGFTAKEIFEVYEKACNMNPAGREFNVKYSEIYRKGEKAFTKEMRDKIPKPWKTPGLHYRAKMNKKTRMKK